MSTPNSETAPRWAVAAWSLTGSASDEPSAGLNTARIVHAAIELADDVGLADLSIRKLGQRMGSGTMAAYRHIDSRDHLVVLMVDVALGPPPGSILEAPTWQAGLRAWADAILVRYAAHPWLIDAPVGGTPETPNRALWLETVLQVLRPSEMSMQRRLDAALLVDGHARNTAHLRREVGKLRANPEPISNAWLGRFLEPEVYPELVSVLAGGELEDDSEPSLDFGLDTIVAGIEALVADRATGA